MANSERIIGLEADGSVPVTIVSGGGTGGTASSFAAAFPPTGTAAGFIDTNGDMAGANLDASGNLLVNVAAGSGNNPAASATGAAVPASASYSGLNVGGNLEGQTGVNPTGSVIAAQTDISSVGGTSIGTSLPVQQALLAGAAKVGQIVIAVTGTRIQLASNALTNGVILSAKSSNNSAGATIGGSSVTNTVDGTGNGYILEAGSSVSFAVDNTNRLYINGTAGDIVSFAGS